MACICMQLKKNCTRKSQVIEQGKAECHLDFYEYNYYLIACKHMRMPTNHIVLPMTLYPYPYDRPQFQLRLTYQCCSTSIALYSTNTFV